jgi:competence protein ComEA
METDQDTAPPSAATSATSDAAPATAQSSTTNVANGGASHVADPLPAPVAAESGEADDDETVSSALGLTASDRRFLWIAAGVVLVLSGIHWARLSGFGQREIEIERLPARRFDFRVDINRATWVEWMQLENIGELTARKIVADRESNGPFRSIDDVNRVPGIGPKTLAAIRPWLRCAECSSEPAEASDASSMCR